MNYTEFKSSMNFLEKVKKSGLKSISKPSLEKQLRLLKANPARHLIENWIEAIELRIKEKENEKSN